MPGHPLFRPVSQSIHAASDREQVRIALAIADPTMLISLLVDSIPPLTQRQRIGSISSQVSVPTDHDHAADGILQFESIQCVLADPQPQLQSQSPSVDRTRDSRELARLTQHESELHTLVQNVALAPAIALLASARFTPAQIEEILRLPRDAWYKSWWYEMDLDGSFTVPFLRCIRTRRHPDGSITVQYKDFFEYAKPGCFVSQPETVLLVIAADRDRFSDTLKQINYQRQALKLRHAILICNTLSELEAQAFIHQGVSVYPAIELALPTQANCPHCGRYECPMNGNPDSPVARCYGFLPESEYV